MTDAGPIRPLLDPRPPLAGESLLSWCVRNAAENHLPGCYALLRRVGQDYLRTPLYAWSGDIDTAALAALLGSGEDEILRRRLAPCGTDGYVLLGGVRVRQADVLTRTRRFAPAALAADGVHMAASMVRSVPFCARTWQLLDDSCHACGKTQRWRHAADMRRCDHCGSDLSLQPATEIAEDLRGPLASVAALVGGSDAERDAALSRLPHALGHLDAGAALELAQQLALIADPGMPAEPPPRATPEEIARHCAAMAEAWTMMEGHPAAALGVIADHAYARRPDDDAGRRRLLSVVAGYARTTLLPEVRAALRTVLDAITKEGNVPAGHLRVKPAAHLLGVTEGQMAEARDAGIVAQTVSLRSGRLLRTLDRAEVEELSSLRRRRIGHHAAAMMLGVPVYAIPQLVDAGALRADTHPWLVHRYGAPFITVEAVDELADRLRADPDLPAASGWQTLGDVMKAMGGGPKPWGAALSLVLADHSDHLGASVGARTIRLSPRLAQRIAALPPAEGLDGYCQMDAAEILNLNAKAAPALDRLREARSGTSWRIDGAALHALAREHVATAELMCRFGLSEKAVSRTLGHAGLRRRALGWIRREAEAIRPALANASRRPRRRAHPPPGRNEDASGSQLRQEGKSR